MIQRDFTSLDTAMTGWQVVDILYYINLFMSEDFRQDLSTYMIFECGELHLGISVIVTFPVVLRD